MYILKGSWNYFHLYIDGLFILGEMLMEIPTLMIHLH